MVLGILFPKKRFKVLGAQTVQSCYGGFANFFGPRTAHLSDWEMYIKKGHMTVVWHLCWRTRSYLHRIF